jgi:hypothetical protein
MLLRYCFAYRNRKRRDIIIILKIVKFNFFNFDGYCGVAADRRRDLGWNPSTLTVLNFKIFFFIEKMAKQKKYCMTSRL